MALAETDDVPAVSTGDLRFYVDFAGFRGKQSQTYQEIYLMLYGDQFQYALQSEKKVASYEAELILQNTVTQQLSKHKWITEATVAQDSADLKALAIYDVWAGELFPGKYSGQLTVKDMHGPQSGLAKFELYVPEYRDSGISA
ncbi:MAG TPA: hypothetical protein VGA99_00460, partial [bacterium]